jgi:hypothetical protein
MAIEKMQSRSLQIGEHTYTVRLMPAGEGLDVAARLMNVIGPGLRGITEEKEGDMLAEFLSELLSKESLSGNLTYFTKMFRRHSSVQVNTPKGDSADVELDKIFDAHFSGNYYELFRWLAFCFEVNHSSFLSGMGVTAQSLNDLAVKWLASKSRKAAGDTGTSGESSSPDSSTKAT